MDAAGIGKKPDAVARGEAKLANRAGGQAADLGHVDMEKRVAAEMLGDRHLAFPAFAVAACLEVLGADADGLRAVPLRRLPAMVHAR